ncbi:MAG: hypothetical protein ACT4O1_11815 [Gemmatimonadota bacterium]
MSGRSGAALIELVTAAVVMGILAVACATLIHSQVTLVRSISERAAANEALRTARLLLRAEFRDVDASDVRAVGRDSLAARVFRGRAVVCIVEYPNAVLRYRGMRVPEPEKDSLLLVGEERVVAFSLGGTTRESCIPRSDEQVVTIATEVRLRANSVVLIFESGTYHLANNALRYRRAAEGKQPITDELIDHRASRFDAEPRGRGIRVRLRSRADAPAVTAADTRIGFSNRVP